MRFFSMQSHLALTDFRLTVPVADRLASCFVPALLREIAPLIRPLAVFAKIPPRLSYSK
jgi:hypothetical protein